MEKKRERKAFPGVLPEVPPPSHGTIQSYVVVFSSPPPGWTSHVPSPLPGRPAHPSFSSGRGPRLPAPACCVTSCSALASCLRRPRRRLSGPFRPVHLREEERETSEAAPWRTSRPSVPTRSSPPSSRTRSGCCSGTRPRRSCPGTTRTSAWASRPPRRPSRAPTLTRSAPSPATSPSAAASCLVSPGPVGWGRGSAAGAPGHSCLGPPRCGDQDEDAEDHRHPPGLPALHPQVQPLREAPQEHVRAPVALLQRRPDRRHRDCGRVQAPQQDREVQRAEGHQGSRDQEAVPEVLSPPGGGGARVPECPPWPCQLLCQ